MDNDNKDIRKRFEVEAKNLKKCDHENIVKLVAPYYIVEDDACYIFMEYIEGQSLQHVIGKKVGPIVHKRAVPIMTQMLSGIGYLHKKQ